jgi:hypothetical protein
MLWHINAYGIYLFMTSLSKLPTHVAGMVCGGIVGAVGLVMFGVSFLVKAIFISLLFFELGGFIVVAAIPFALFFWLLFKLGKID